MKYEVEVSKECKNYFDSFEQDFCQKVKALANTKEFLHLRITYSLKISKPTSNSKLFDVVGNASFSIDKSLNFKAEVAAYLEGKKSIFTSMLGEKALLSVTLNFEVRKDVPSEQQSESKDEPSPFIAKDPIYTLDQMILPDDLLKEMKAAINAVKYQKLIYEEWGFKQVDPVPKCVLNFYGPPGTGKTMAAHALAASIGKKIMEANYGDIESKYVGDAPKNMKKVFARAKEEDCVLFFDEADSVMGKRMSNVSHGSEQAINSLRSETLKHLEQHEGIVIMATNLITTFDPAFKSRILKSLKFELPNKEARMDMIRKKIPAQMPIDAPLTDEQIAELSDIADGMSGRDIKNAFIDMAQHKADECGEAGVFSFEDFKSAFTRQKEMIDALKREEKKEKEEKILNALRQKSPEECKGRIQSLLEDKTPEERKEIMDEVYAKIAEVDKMREEERKKEEEGKEEEEVEEV